MQTETLTGLARLARRRPGSVNLLSAAIDGRMEALAKTAVEIALEVGDPIGMVLASKISEQGSLRLTRQLLEVCEKRGISGATPLREVTLALTRRVLEGFTETWAKGGEKTRVEIVRLLNNLAHRQSAVGDHQESLETLNEALTLANELVRNQAGPFLLGLTHHNIGMVWNELDRHEEAAEATTRAVAIRRELAESTTQSTRQELAFSLNNLSAQLGSSGRLQGALEAAKESVELLQQLTAEDPLRFQAQLATAFNTLSQRFVKLRQIRQAAMAAEQAVIRLRPLAAEQPERFEPELATALHNLGSLEREVGDPAKAVDAAREAVRLQEKLFAARPAPFRMSLTTCLDGLGTALLKVDRSEDALKHFDRAVSLFEVLVESDAEATTQRLAVCRVNRSAALCSSGRFEEGLEECSAAMDMLRGLPGAHGDHSQNLALALAARGAHLANLGRDAEALEDAVEVSGIYRRLDSKHPESFCKRLANSLETLARRQLSVGQTEAAGFSIEEAVKLYRKALQPQDSAESLGTEIPEDFAQRIRQPGPDDFQPDRFETAIELVIALCRWAPILRSQERPGDIVERLEEALFTLAPYLEGSEDSSETIEAIEKIYVGLAKDAGRPANEKLRAILRAA